MKGFYRTFALAGALAAGALAPQAEALKGGIRWLVMGILFLFFLQLRWSALRLERSHAWLLVANVAVGFAGFGLGWLTGWRDVALGLFFAGIAPTATAASVVVFFLRGRADYVVSAFLVTSAGTLALAPFLFPLVLGHDTPGLFWKILGSVGVTICVPLAAACLLRRVWRRAGEGARWMGNLSFGLWVSALFLVMASASGYFLRERAGLPLWELVAMAGGSLAVCAASFALGGLIGGREFGREGSQSLGQKNTTLMIYLALTYANPLAALGPTFYVVWHNVWNSLQLARSGRGSGAGRGD
jgi:BASS family bile acid:Na+ symporter